MFESLLKRRRARKNGKVSRVPRRAAPARLRLEALEDRCCPTAVYWDPGIGGGGGDAFSWTNINNWATKNADGTAAAYGMVPQAGDTVGIWAGAANETPYIKDGSLQTITALVDKNQNGNDSQMTVYIKKSAGGTASKLKTTGASQLTYASAFNAAFYSSVTMEDTCYWDVNGSGATLLLKNGVSLKGTDATHHGYLIVDDGGSLTLQPTGTGTGQQVSTSCDIDIGFTATSTGDCYLSSSTAGNVLFNNNAMVTVQPGSSLNFQAYSTSGVGFRSLGDNNTSRILNYGTVQFATPPSAVTYREDLPIQNVDKTGTGNSGLVLFYHDSHVDFSQGSGYYSYDLYSQASSPGNSPTVVLYENTTVDGKAGKQFDIVSGTIKFFSSIVATADWTCTFNENLLLEGGDCWLGDNVSPYYITLKTRNFTVTGGSTLKLHVKGDGTDLSSVQVQSGYSFMLGTSPLSTAYLYVYEDGSVTPSHTWDILTYPSESGWLLDFTTVSFSGQSLAHNNGTTAYRLAS